MTDPAGHPYAEQAHEARMTALAELRDEGCSCQPYLAVAIVENVYDELVADVLVQGHEPRCVLNAEGRVN